ncbi:hypothetical protein TWF694_006570 [Orbilia ellipsospora]|uniref:Protein kinase domain-containing protein n=1 Tax=Orbilia ellipsospora TaxID=2528407 RepID=A0AAV9XKK3_9PEZI
MEVAQPFYLYIATGLSPDDKKEVRDQMIKAVEVLHNEKNMIHGDIKPANFLKCSDGRIVLFDFESARLMDEDHHAWMDGDGQRTSGYYSSECLNRCPGSYNISPTKFDDQYALAFSVWELYTGKISLSEFPYGGDNLMDYIKGGRTVDVMEVEDLETREWIAKMLREGDANFTI